MTRRKRRNFPSTTTENGDFIYGKSYFYGENNQKYMSKKIIIIYEIVTIEEKIECKYTL